MIAQFQLRWRSAYARRSSRRVLLDAALVLILAVASHAVYRASAGTVQLCDSTYSLVAAEQFLATGSFDLRDRIPTEDVARRAMPGCHPGQDLPYHLVRKPDPRNPEGPPRIHYGYPLGSSVLSLPWVWHYATNKGMSSFGPDGVPSYVNEGIIQHRIASTVAAGIVVLFYFLGRFFCSPPVSGLIAAGFAFGSPLWSTMSRALWSHTWMGFWLAFAIVLLVAARRFRNETWKSDFAFGCGIGTALFWAAVCRQHVVLSALAIGVYLLVQNRRLFTFTVLSGGTWAVAFVLLSLSYFGTPMTPSVYSAGTIDFRDIPGRFVGLLVSPSRGLLIYCPYLAVVAALLVACRRHLRDAGLLLPALLALGAHTALFSSYNGWHGNWAYGPRYFCDVLPWFVLLTAMSVQALGTMPIARWYKLVAVAGLVACFGWSGFVHYRGANVKAAWHWNDLTRTLGDEGAVKDWRHPQFLTGITFEVNPDGTVIAK